MSIKVKAKGKDAKDLLGIKSAFKAGGKRMMPENPASRRAEGFGDGLQHGEDYMDRNPSNSQETNVQEGYGIVETVASRVPANYPETARRKNNSARDQRSNLGRGKAGVVEIE